MTQEIPDAVLDGIRCSAKMIWPDDPKEQEDYFITECEAFVELSGLSPDDVPADRLVGMKQRAVAKHDEHEYLAQLEEVQKAIKDYRYIQQTRVKIAPIRDMLARMESIIGSACYNPNIQNYWGEREEYGRSFRYPVTYIYNGKKVKAQADALRPEELITGHYDLVRMH